MLQLWRENRWFTDSYWPENRPRVERIARDLLQLVPGGRVFEPGCGSGYVSYLVARVGFDVIACDAWSPPERDEAFASAGIDFFSANLNHLDPWPQIADRTFNAVVLGEVFEHILNFPLGLLRQVHRVLAPGGVFILTTPNPSTLLNAFRVLKGSHSLWGTEAFASTAKVIDGSIIDRGDIHYREYRQDELLAFMHAAGFTDVTASYVCMGSPKDENPLKRAVKAIPGIGRHRMFGSGHYIIARS